MSKSEVILTLEKKKIQRREFRKVRKEGLELENTSSDEGSNSFFESETDEEEVQDNHSCGGCGETCATLDLFVKHKIVCNSRKKTTKNRKVILRFDRHSLKVESDDRYEINLNAEQRDDGLKCIKGITIVAEQPAEQIEELAEQSTGLAEQSKGLAETYKKPIELEQEKKKQVSRNEQETDRIRTRTK